MWARISTSYKTWDVIKAVIKTKASKTVGEVRSLKGKNARGLEVRIVVEA